MKRTKFNLITALIGLLSLSGVTIAQADVPRGIAITPRNFPNHTSADVDEAFHLARELGRHAVFIYQWGELNLDVVKIMFHKKVMIYVEQQEQERSDQDFKINGDT